MDQRHFQEPSIDDLMRAVIRGLSEFGHKAIASKGSMTELVAVHLELTNPRARLSRTETRGKAFSCIGELFWYLSGSDDLDFISYYIPIYERFADDGKLHGAYGPRLVNWNGINQVEAIVDLLNQKRSSRQAAIQIFDRRDLQSGKKDIPCTCTFQFLIRNEKLVMITYMRSNDVFLGLPHDIFSFSMIQEIIACSLGVALGAYHHFVGSLHLYDRDVEATNLFIGEGWQSREDFMPEMPHGDPREYLPKLLELEEAIRLGNEIDDLAFRSVDPYWADIIRLLMIFKLYKKKDAVNIEAIRENITFPVYLSFIQTKINQLTERLL